MLDDLVILWWRREVGGSRIEFGKHFVIDALVSEDAVEETLQSRSDCVRSREEEKERLSFHILDGQGAAILAFRFQDTTTSSAPPIPF